MHRHRNRQSQTGPNWLRRSAEALGGRAFLCLDQPQSTSGQRLRGDHRVQPRLPLCGISHDPRSSSGALNMTFETDSQRLDVRSRLRASEAEEMRRLTKVGEHMRNLIKCGIVSIVVLLGADAAWANLKFGVAAEPYPPF